MMCLKGGSKSDKLGKRLRRCAFIIGMIKEICLIGVVRVLDRRTYVKKLTQHDRDMDDEEDQIHEIALSLENGGRHLCSCCCSSVAKMGRR
jgi:hypothetical protein